MGSIQEYSTPLRDERRPSYMIFRRIKIPIAPSGEKTSPQKGETTKEGEKFFIGKIHQQYTNCTIIRITTHANYVEFAYIPTSQLFPRAIRGDEVNFTAMDDIWYMPTYGTCCSLLIKSFSLDPNTTNSN